MKALIRVIARRLLPMARRSWQMLPEPSRRRLRPVVRRLRTWAGLGNWRSAPRQYRLALEGVHPLVPVRPVAPSLPIPPAPRTPPTPIVSVVVTAHDDGAFLDTCLASIRAQTLDEWECIVVDDASIDDTAEIARRHAEADPRIRLVRRDGNVGLAAARNTGIACASGEFLAFLDADDFMFPDGLRVRAEVARSDDPTIAGSWCDWASVAEPAGLEFAPPRPGNFETIDYLTGGGENQTISTSPMIRAEVVRSLGGYDDGFRTAEDFEFATRLFRNGFRLAYAPVVGVAYRQKRSSMISGDPCGHARNAMRIYDYMMHPLDDDAICATAVSPFVEPPPAIPSDVKRLERLISFLTFAVIGGDDAQISGVVSLIPPGLLGAGSFLLDVDGRIEVALRRHSTRVDALGRAEEERVATRVKSLLAERGRATGTDEPVERHRGHIDSSRLRRLPPTTSRVRSVRTVPEAGPWDVVLIADDVDAARELLLVGRELVDDGLRVAMTDRGVDDLRRTMAAEGVHRVVAPVASPRLLITSDGDTAGIDAPAHLVVAAEPWVRPRPSAAADVVHARGQWEASCFGAATAVEVIGWHSRADRIDGFADPKDGQADRSRGDSVLVLAHGTGSLPSPESLRAVIPESPLLFSPEFLAEPEVTVDSVRVRTIAPLVRAVLTFGDALPADALAFGTPVLAIEHPGAAGARSISFDELPRALAAATPLQVGPVGGVDALQAHVDAAHRLLGVTG